MLKIYRHKIITNIIINMAVYILSSKCFIVMGPRGSIRSPKLKMLDDRVHNMVMILSLDKFSLSPSTHQNLFKLL